MSSFEALEQKLKELLPNLSEGAGIRIALALDETFKDYYKDLDFLRGGRAFFDALRIAVANNWHGRPEVNGQCRIENEIVMRFAEDALQSFDSQAHNRWLEIGKLQAEVQNMRQQIKDLTLKLEAK